MFHKEMLLSRAEKGFVVEIVSGSYKIIGSDYLYGFQSVGRKVGSCPNPNTKYGTLTKLSCMFDTSYFRVEFNFGTSLQITRLDTGKSMTFTEAPGDSLEYIATGMFFGSGDNGKTIKCQIVQI